MCETKNNVWKKYELSIQNGIDNCTEIIKIKPDFASSSDEKFYTDYFIWQVIYGLPAIFDIISFT